MTPARSTAGVPWRRVFALVGVAALVAGALSFVFRADGIPAVDASSSQATRWFVHQPTGVGDRLDLVGRPVARPAVEDGALGVGVGVPQAEAHRETVELDVGQGERALEVARVLGGDDEEGAWDPACGTVAGPYVPPSPRAAPIGSSGSRD